MLWDFSEANQEKIVEAGGLGSLLNLLQSSEDETIRRVAAGAVANLAMNGDTSYLCFILFLTNSVIYQLIGILAQFYGQPDSAILVF